MEISQRYEKRKGLVSLTKGDSLTFIWREERASSVHPQCLHFFFFSFLYGDWVSFKQKDK